MHSLDVATEAKTEFLQTFDQLILKPRSLDYKVQFPGPTGANAVEAALKLARKSTGRESIISFTNAFHGMTLGALSVTGNSMKRAGAGIPLVHSTPMPYDNYFDGVTEDFHWFERVLDDSGSGLNRPAAVIVETVQGEGGLNVARIEWLQALAELCRRRDILLIVDDVQMGCGRTGPFFSFEEAGIVPDIVTLSKSISGYGLPMALTLFRRDLDLWAPGEHNGTFRGHNPAFVTAATALKTYWQDTRPQRGDRRQGRAHSRTPRGHCGDARRRQCTWPRHGSGAEVRGSQPRRRSVPRSLRPRGAHGDQRTLGRGRQATAAPHHVPCRSDLGARRTGRSRCRSDGVTASRRIRRTRKRRLTMIVRTTDEITGTERDVSDKAWRSKRIVLAGDGVGFSFHETTIDANSVSEFHYQHHVEAVWVSRVRAR